MANTTLKGDSVLWKIYSEVSAAAKEKALSKSGARGAVTRAMADEYGIPASAINQYSEKVLYSNVSKITRLIFPSTSAAKANLQREIARGGLAFNDALLIARGKASTREECRSYRPDGFAPTTPNLELSALFSALIRTAIEAGYSSQSIVSAFEEAFDAQDLSDSRCWVAAPLRFSRRRITQAA